MLFQTSLYDHLKIEYSNTQMPSVAKRSWQFSNIWDTFIPIVFIRVRMHSRNVQNTLVATKSTIEIQYLHLNFHGVDLDNMFSHFHAFPIADLISVCYLKYSFPPKLFPSQIFIASIIRFNFMLDRCRFHFIHLSCIIFSPISIHL